MIFLRWDMLVPWRVIMVTAWVKVDDTVSMVWGMYKPCINLTFGDCAMYFDHGVYVNRRNMCPRYVNMTCQFIVNSSLQGNVVILCKNGRKTLSHL